MEVQQRDKHKSLSEESDMWFMCWKSIHKEKYREWTEKWIKPPLTRKKRINGEVWGQKSSLCEFGISSLWYDMHHPTQIKNKKTINTWIRCLRRQCNIVWAWGVGSKHGNSVQAENDIRWETPTTTPAFGRSPRGYTSRSNSSSGSN